MSTIKTVSLRQMNVNSLCIPFFNMEGKDLLTFDYNSGKETPQSVGQPWNELPSSLAHGWTAQELVVGHDLTESKIPPYKAELRTGRKVEIVFTPKRAKEEYEKFLALFEGNGPFASREWTYNVATGERKRGEPMPPHAQTINTADVLHAVQHFAKGEKTILPISGQRRAFSIWWALALSRKLKIIDKYEEYLINVNVVPFVSHEDTARMQMRDNGEPGKHEYDDSGILFNAVREMNADPTISRDRLGDILGLKSGNKQKYWYWAHLERNHTRAGGLGLNLVKRASIAPPSSVKTIESHPHKEAYWADGDMVKMRYIPKGPIIFKSLGQQSGRYLLNGTDSDAAKKEPAVVLAMGENQNRPASLDEIEKYFANEFGGIKTKPGLNATQIATAAKGADMGAKVGTLAQFAECVASGDASFATLSPPKGFLTEESVKLLIKDIDKEASANVKETLQALLAGDADYFASLRKPQASKKTAKKASA